MNNELLEALNVLEEEKNISKDTLLEAIENSLVTACTAKFLTAFRMYRSRIRINILTVLWLCADMQ